MTETNAYWQLPYSQWEANTEIQLPIKQYKGTDYVTYHNMVRALRQHCPGLIPEMLEATPLEDGTIILKLRLWDNHSSTGSQVHRIAIMALGTSSHHAKPCPDARSLQDGIRRAICRVISEETGLGYQLWLRDEDEYPTEVQLPQQQQMPWQQHQQQQPAEVFNNLPNEMLNNFLQPQPQAQAQQPPQRQRL
jgi:hypothetical protein